MKFLFLTILVFSTSSFATQTVSQNGTMSSPSSTMGTSGSMGSGTTGTMGTMNGRSGNQQPSSSDGAIIDGGTMNQDGMNRQGTKQDNRGKTNLDREESNPNRNQRNNWNDRNVAPIPNTRR